VVAVKYVLLVAELREEPGVEHPDELRRAVVARAAEAGAVQISSAVVDRRDAREAQERALDMLRELRP
jgi:pyridoxine 5'-phosphate synthase PdxJ